MHKENLNSTSTDTNLDGSHRNVIQTRAQPQGLKHINMCYLFCLLITISFGTIQFGYSIASWNTANDAFVRLQNWDKEKATSFQTQAQTITTLGAAIGALFSGPVLSIGRWNCILLTNLFVIVGAGLTLIDDEYLVLVGRFFYGVSCGCFSVFCPKYISEVAPVEVKGPAGAFSQICITFGILLPFSIGLFYTDLDSEDNNRTLINLVFIIPIVFGIIQVLLLLLVFRYDTPQMLKQKNELQKLREFLCKIYDPSVVQDRIDEIQVGGGEGGSSGQAGYGAVCCSSQYKRSTYVGCALSIFQQLTGINFIMFYSNTLFGNLGLPAQQITGLVGVVNFLTTFGGLFLLSIAGRRTIMMFSSATMAALLIFNGFFSLNEDNTLAIVCTMGFIAFFEFSSGPITWLYMAEIMQDKALSIATVLNWCINLIISLITPSLIKTIGEENIGYIFIVMGGFTVLGTLFIITFMKETRGKTQAEIEEMFAGTEHRSQSKKLLYNDKANDF